MISHSHYTRLSARTAPVAVAPVAVAPVAAKRYRTRLAAAEKRGQLDDRQRQAWALDGPRVLLIMRAVKRRILVLMTDLRRAYRTKPYSWIVENFDPRIKVFRDQAQWIGDQLRPHSTAVVAEPEFGELIVALEACGVLCAKVLAKGKK